MSDPTATPVESAPVESAPVEPATAPETTPTKWQDTIPETAREWDEFKNSESMEAAFDRIGHMRSKFGTGLYPPGEDAGAEDWSTFYGKLSERTQGKVMPRPSDDDPEAMGALYRQLGKPDEVTGYEFIEGTDADIANAVGAIAHANNLSVAQMKALDEGMSKIVEEQTAAHAQQVQEGVANLKGEWGAAWDERSAVVNKVRENFLSFIPADAMNADTMQALYAVGKALGGEGAETLQQTGVAPEPTVSESKERIAEITSRIGELQRENNSFARDEIKRLTEKRRAFYKKAYPGGGFTVGGSQVG